MFESGIQDRLGAVAALPYHREVLVQASRGGFIAFDSKAFVSKDLDSKGLTSLSCHRNDG